VRALSTVDHRAKELPAAERLAQGRAQSEPALAGLSDRLLAWKQQLLPKQLIAEALNYALGQWEELTVFCSDGAVPIDDNVSEREITITSAGDFASWHSERFCATPGWLSRLPGMGSMDGRTHV